MMRRKKPANRLNKSHMISYGGMLTAFLACFIVLNSLAEDQTGAKLQAGTGSFNDALGSFGLPDAADSGVEQPIQYVAPGLQYILPAPAEADTEHDEERNQIVDREENDYQRFLIELGRMSQVEQLPAIEGDVSFDCFESLNDDDQPIPPSLWESANNLRPLFDQQDYEIELTVWAATPSQSAWTRAAEQAVTLRDTIAARLQLSEEAVARFQAVSRPWLYSNLDRPTASLTVRRLGTK